MPTSERTKRLIAQSFKQKMETIPFARISIGDIARDSQVSRNTFYYHFKDKYDILQWIFRTELEPIIQDSMKEADWGSRTVKLCRHMQQNKKFYNNALKIQGSGNLYSVLFTFYQDMLCGRLKKLQGDAALNELEIRSIASFLAHGLTGELVEWVKDGMAEDLEQRVRTLERILAERNLEQLLHAVPADAPKDGEGP